LSETQSSQGGAAPAILIRRARETDVPALLRLLRAFAAFEKLAHALTITEEDLRRDGFGPTPRFRALVGEAEGRIVAFVTYYPVYISSFRGEAGMFVEDLFVDEACRDRGVARRLLAAIARETAAEGGKGLSLSVLDWNPARRFYDRLGFAETKGWLPYRLSGAAFQRLIEEQRE